MSAYNVCLSNIKLESKYLRKTEPSGAVAHSTCGQNGTLHSSVGMCVGVGWDVGEGDSHSDT